MKISASSGNRKKGIGEEIARLALKADSKTDKDLLVALNQYLFNGGVINIWHGESLDGKPIRSLFRNHPKPDYFEINRTRYLAHERKR